MAVGVVATWEGQANSSWNGPGKLSRKGGGVCGQIWRSSWAESSVQCCSSSRSSMNMAETEAVCLRLEQGRQRSSSCWRRGLFAGRTGLYYYELRRSSQTTESLTQISALPERFSHQGVPGQSLDSYQESRAVLRPSAHPACTSVGAQAVASVSTWTSAIHLRAPIFLKSCSSARGN